MYCNRVVIALPISSNNFGNAQHNMIGYVHSPSVEISHRSMPINSTIYFVANQFSYCPVSLPKIVAYFFLKYVF